MRYLCININYRKSIVLERYRYLVLTGPVLALVMVTLWRGGLLTSSKRHHSGTTFNENNTQTKSMSAGNDAGVQIACVEHKNIIFAKVHKTGSSTVSNILQRFGSVRKLTFVLPKKTSRDSRYNYIGGPEDSISKDNIRLAPSGEHFNILCNHVIYNRNAFINIFPSQKQYFYLSIIREPLEHFLSVIRYYGYSESSYIRDILTMNSTNPLSEYLKNPTEFEPRNPYYSFTNNRQILDLGLRPDAFSNLSAIYATVETIRKEFDFVMLLEYFDESLVYVKRKLCWSYKDIIYYPKNGRWNNEKYKLSVHDLQMLRTWNTADYILYDRLHGEFWIKVHKEGPDFFDEVLHFKRITELVRRYCVSADVTSPLVIGGSRWEGNFTLTTIDCLMMGLSELQFLDKIFYESYGITHNKH